MPKIRNFAEGVKYARKIQRRRDFESIKDTMYAALGFSVLVLAAVGVRRKLRSN